MKKGLFCFIISMLLVLITFTGCTDEFIDADVDAPVTLSGDLAFFAEMDDSELEEKCEGAQIEITGAVSYSGYSLVYIGEIIKDNICFNCTFSGYSDELNNIKVGEIVTIRGTYEYIIGDYVHLDDCELVTNTTSEMDEGSSEETSVDIDASSETTYIELVSTESATVITPETEPTEPTKAVPTNPPHTHKFSAATCTSPKKCSCGATEGTANGHSWNSATCTTPKTCSVCGITSGLTAGHDFYNGYCTSCGKEDPDYIRETMVWIPTNGGTKYHTHSGCSGMENPEKVTESYAESLGFTPCKRCH